MPNSSFFWSMAAILGDVARRPRSRAMPPATMTMKTQTHGFLNFYPCTIVMGLLLYRPGKFIRCEYKLKRAF